MYKVPRKMELRSLRVHPSQIGYIKWLLEAHDGLATPTTRQGAGDIIDFLLAPDFADEFDELFRALGEELEIEFVGGPSEPPLGG